MKPIRTIAGSLLALLIAMSAGPSLAQQQGGHPPERPGMQRDSGGGRMSGEERQRLREELQRQQAAPHRADEERARRYAEWQRLSPEQRERVRGDMRDANRDFERRR